MDAEAPRDRKDDLRAASERGTRKDQAKHLHDESDLHSLSHAEYYADHVGKPVHLIRQAALDESFCALEGESLRLFHGKHRSNGGADNAVAHTAQKTANGAKSSTAHYDKVAGVIVSVIDDSIDS